MYTSDCLFQCIIAGCGGDLAGAGCRRVCSEAEPQAPVGCHDGLVWGPSSQVQAHLQVHRNVCYAKI